ncbi:MAG: DEAD/DEAH box helicase [Solirubrobacterales bacterium]|nr:DEAD/DEAH box helicase [Solirubrobacterales bacterium]
MNPDPLESFSPVVRRWFEASFEGPTPAQAEGWRAISGGADTLICAPTGSGKTLASFLWGIDRLARERTDEDRPPGVRLLYVSPLKALSYDIERNLRAPLRGIGAEITVGLRTGDTPQSERARMRRRPPEILITTPESLYLMISSGAREILRTVETVIVDEIHAVAATKRGAHLALTLERLDQLTGERRMQRIGLSATQRPLERIARFLSGPGRECEVIDPGQRKELDLEIVVPVEDMSNPAADADPAEGEDPPIRSIWPAIYPELLNQVRAHRSTIIFVNNRRGAERLAQRLNDLDTETPSPEDRAGADGPLARAHHGSLSHEERTEVEEQLKAGTIPCLVATSSLELGIDMGAVDLVIQVESPKSVARGMQRVGRAGHGLGEVSKGRIFPKFRADLLESAVVAQRMREGAIEETTIPSNPLDVLAQHLVSMAALDLWDTGEALELIRRTAPFAELSRDQFENVLDMLDGRYPSDRFAELRPRLVWDRTAGTITGRKGARSLVVTNAGTIPDRGLYGVHLPDGRRVGELDEEMVYEARAGQVFLLGASSWRIQEITRDRVIVVPAPGVPGTVPFWKGDGIGRPAELGEAIGAFSREAVAADPVALERSHHLDPRAARNLVAYLREQQEATRVVPSDRTVVVERFRDEIGDWRLCVLTPWGGRVHAAWALAIAERLKGELDLEVDAIHSDDGIAIHLPDAEDPPAADLVLIEPDELEELVVAGLGGSALFGARFRENAARSLLLPRAYPGRRTPLWQQRLKAQSLLEVARGFPRFPVTLETYRECLGDVFDLASLERLLRGISSREISLVEVETATASPFASSLIFDYVATYMYEGDAPNAERRATALSLDRELLRELLGQEELRDLIDPEALAAVEASLQHLTEAGRAADADGLQQILRRVGDLSAAEAAERVQPGLPSEAMLERLVGERRAAEVMINGERRYIAAEDAGLYRDALGVVPPGGLPTGFLEERAEPLLELVSRYARSHGPFPPARLRDRYGVDPAPALRELERDGILVQGEILPGGSGREWCDAEVLRRIRRASLARLRQEVEPADAAAYARFLASWHGVDRRPSRGGVDRLREILIPLQGVALTRSVWEQDVLPRRLGSYSPAWLDELCTSGELVWIGAGAVGRTDGRVALYFREDVRLAGPPPGNAKLDAPEGEAHDAIRTALAESPSFWTDLAAVLEFGPEELHGALWDLAFAGEITNDSFAPLRARRHRSVPASGSRSRRFSRRRPAAGATVQGRWSLTEILFRGPVDQAARARTQAELLLERHGILTREMALAEGIPGGFSTIYPELSALEMLGGARRGYFVEGLGGQQFALSGAVERLRSVPDPERGEPEEMVVLAATDPANPWGAALPWPPLEGRRSPARTAGAWVLARGGRPLIYVERGGRGLLTLDPRPADSELDAAFAALLVEAEAGRIGPLKIERIDGEPVIGTPMETRLTAAGFGRQPRNLTAPT